MKKKRFFGLLIYGIPFDQFSQTNSSTWYSWTFRGDFHNFEEVKLGRKEGMKEAEIYKINQPNRQLNSIIIIMLVTHTWHKCIFDSCSLCISLMCPIIMNRRDLFNILHTTVTETKVSTDLVLLLNFLKMICKIEKSSQFHQNIDIPYSL